MLTFTDVEETKAVSAQSFKEFGVTQHFKETN
jgi:hypothetical protein